MMSRQAIIGDPRLSPEFIYHWTALSMSGRAAKVTTDTSSMTKALLAEWLPGALCNYRERAGLKNEVPLIVMCDGHASRYNIDLWKKLKDMNVFLLLLPAHLSHVFQVIDVALARALKARPAFRHANTALFPKLHPARAIAPYMYNIARTCMCVSEAWCAWMTTGLFPLNLSCIDGREFLKLINPRLAKKITDSTGTDTELKVQCAAIKSMYKEHPAPPSVEELKARSLGGICVTHSDELAALLEVESARVKSAWNAASAAGKKRVVGLWLIGIADELMQQPHGSSDDATGAEVSGECPILGEEIIPTSSSPTRQRRRPSPSTPVPSPPRKRRRARASAQNGG